MKRRQLLRTASITAVGISALAGCTGPDGGGEGTEPGEGGTEPGEGTPAEATDTEEGTPTEEGTGTEEGTSAGTETGGAGGNIYEFGGKVQAWIGQAPSDIEGKENPTIQLEAGQDYEISWTNLDGQPHDFTIQDSDGNAIEQTEQSAEKGATLTLSFTATEKMAQYICTVHPTTMVGEIQMGGGS